MLIKISWMLRIFIIGIVTSNLFINTPALGASEEYEAELEKYAKLTEVISGGFYSGSQVFIRIGGNTFYDYQGARVGLAGVYVLAIYKNEVLLRYHYNTYFLGGASLGFARDIGKLPYGTFVVVAAKGEPTRLFDENGQKALYQIGAVKGLLNQKFRTSYLCIGVKGLAQGKAIEKIGIEELKHIGEKAGEQINLVFPKKKEPQGFSRMPGRHEGLMFGDTEVIYYIPKYFDPDTAQYLVGIHGAGAWRRPGALTRIAQFRSTADRDNIVIIAPAFTDVLNRTPNRKKDIKDGKFIDPKIIKARRSFMMLLNGSNEDRSDLKLIEIFEFFNEKLMKRDKFYLDGHSGGGQFVARFVLFHPELIDKAAICSAGSFVFPNRDKDYPYGLKLDNLEKTFGPQIQADDLKLNDEQTNQKLNQMLDLKIFIIAGEKETVQEDRPERNWQGKSTLEKARNFYNIMKEEDKRLKQKGVRSSAKPYLFELHIIPNVGHNSHATAAKATELLFPTKKKIKDKILYIDFSKGILDRSGNRNKIKSKSKPKVYHGRAIFDPRKKQHLHIQLNKASDLIGCTEMTISVSLRIEPQPNQYRRSWIVHTDDYHRFGTALVLDKDNKVNAWIQTTSPKRRPVGKDMKPIAGKSPALTSQKRIDDGQWHDIRLTYTGEEVMLFIDDVLQNKLDWEGALVNASQTNIGYLEQHRSYFNGEIAEIEVYGRSILP